MQFRNTRKNSRTHLFEKNCLINSGPGKIEAVSLKFFQTNIMVMSFGQFRSFFFWWRIMYFLLHLLFISFCTQYHYAVSILGKEELWSLTSLSPVDPATRGSSTGHRRPADQRRHQAPCGEGAGSHSGWQGWRVEASKNLYPTKKVTAGEATLQPWKYMLKD